MDPSGPDDVKIRCHLRSLRRVAEEHSAAVATTHRAERLLRNVIQTRELESDEAVARELVVDAFLEVHRRASGRFGAVTDAVAMRSTAALIRQGTCDAKYHRLQQRDAQRDAETEAWFREQGKTLLLESRDRDTQMRLRQMERRRQMKEDMQSITAAFAHVKGEESRQRQQLNNELDSFFDTFFSTEVTEREHTRVWAIEQAQRDAAANAKAILMEQESMQQQQQAKREAEQRKEQARLRGKCTHGPRGTSVFVGSFSKKMCLMCKVKVDAATGLLVPIR